jgi:uncharacterized protein
MEYVETRQTKIERLAGDGDIEALEKVFESGHIQSELDSALENAIAYSQIRTAQYLLAMGADIRSNNYNGAYYAAHNNELTGLRFAVENGVGINANNGMLLTTAIVTATNTKSIEMVHWLLENGANTKLLKPDSLKLVRDYGTKELKDLIKNAT